MKNKAILAIIMVAVMLVGCGGVKEKVTSKISKEKEEKIEDVMEEVTQSGGEDESLEDTTEDVVEEESAEPVPAETVASNESQKKSQKTETKKPTEPVAPVVTTPVVAVPEATEPECQHQWGKEQFYYDVFDKMTFGCNGCGLALFEWANDKSSVEHIENLYFHEPCPTDRFPEPCCGGGYHSESITIGFCALCTLSADDLEGRVIYRQCMWTEMGKRCSKNTVLGEYEKVEFDQNHFMYYDSCKCGKNMIFVNGRDDDHENGGKGIIFGKEKCTICGIYKEN